MFDKKVIRLQNAEVFSLVDQTFHWIPKVLPFWTPRVALPPESKGLFFFQTLKCSGAIWYLSKGQVLHFTFEPFCLCPLQRMQSLENGSVELKGSTNQKMSSCQSGDHDCMLGTLTHTSIYQSGWYLNTQGSAKNYAPARFSSVQCWWKKSCTSW